MLCKLAAALMTAGALLSAPAQAKGLSTTGVGGSLAFQPLSSELSAEARAQLDSLALLLQADPKRSLTLTTRLVNDKGKRLYKHLSELRAFRAFLYLADTLPPLGIAPHRVSVQSESIATLPPNDFQDAENNRVYFIWKTTAVTSTAPTSHDSTAAGDTPASQAAQGMAEGAHGAQMLVYFQFDNTELEPSESDRLATLAARLRGTPSA